MSEMSDVEKVKQGGKNPWRRLFARVFDYWFYFVLWCVIVNLTIPRDMTSWMLLGLVGSVAFMIILEPILLSIFGTTPGKVLFGVRLRNLNGRKLTFIQAYIRTWSVFVRGQGFSIPGYNLYRMYKSYLECKVQGVTKWDEQGDYVCAAKLRNPMLLAAACIVSVILGVGIMSATHFAADMPMHRGELTVAQFNENMDLYWQFHRLPWHERRVHQLDEYPWEPGEQPPEMYIVPNENGIIIEVGIEMIDADIDDFWILIEWMRALLINFVGAQDGVNFYRMHFAGGVFSYAYPMVAGLPYRGPVNESFIVHGVEVRFEFSSDLERGTMTASFIMRKV